MAKTGLLSLSLMALALSGCQTLTTTVPVAESAPIMTPTPAASTPAANDGLNALAWMQTSVEFRLLVGQTWRSALGQLDRAIKTPGWDALTPEDRDSPALGKPLAVIVDVDETVLDNSSYQARLVRAGTGFDEAAWNVWVHEEAAIAEPGALEFARAASARGVTIFYISNRAATLTETTVANLRKVGFPIKDSSQFLGLGTVTEGCQSSGSEKGCRRQWVGRTHRVLMQFGDQIGDLVTLTANTREGRDAAVKPYVGWVGERWFVLPNPSYGSWEPALYNNDRGLSEAERRRLKLEALRY